MEICFLNDWIGSDKKLTILDLSGVPFEVLDITIGLITRFVYDSMFWGRNESYTGKNRPLLLAFEEAHAYLNKDDNNSYSKNSVEIKDGERRIALCHYPMLSWGGAARGALHIHAHIHNKKDGLTFEALRRMDNALNASVEINDYKPAILEELILNNRKFKDS